MKVKIQIDTPQGQAKGTLKKVNWWFRLLSRAKIVTYCNHEDSQIIIEVEGTPRQIIGVTKNVQYFNILPKLILETKVTKNAIRTRFPEATDDDFKQLQDMFDNGTKISIIKEASANELVEDGLTWWQRIKSKYAKL